MFKKLNCNIIILSGGLGTRLGKLTKKIPKPLLKVNKKPFLEYLINYFTTFGFKDFYLATHFKNEQFVDFKKKIKKSNNKINLSLIKEKKLLGTGGAVKNTLNKTKNNNNIVINADTFIVCNFKKIYDLFKNYNFAIIGNYIIDNSNRYGRIISKKNIVVNFIEKKQNNYKKKILINSGVFFFKKNKALKVFNKFQDKFSLEEEVYKEIINSKDNLVLIKQKAPFIDIGIPKDLKKSEHFIRKYSNNI